MSKIPDFNDEGLLPEGIHWMSFDDVEGNFCFSSSRINLFSRLRPALEILRNHGCQEIYIDGSFATSETKPNDIDVCWSLTGVNLKELQKAEPVFFDFSYKRAFQKIKYGCEFFPSESVAAVDPIRIFLDFFQKTRDGKNKGIIGIKL